MKAGDKLFSGAIVTPWLADAYNAATAKIESFERDGKPVPENLLNGRHNLLASFVENDRKASALQTRKTSGGKWAAWLGVESGENARFVVAGYDNEADAIAAMRFKEMESSS